MARKIPPFAALRAFEALARRGTLQEAADELHISSSAVSHQVKSLETFLKEAGTAGEKVDKLTLKKKDLIGKDGSILVLTP